LERVEKLKVNETSVRGEVQIRGGYDPWKEMGYLKRTGSVGGAGGGESSRVRSIYLRTENGGRRGGSMAFY